MKRIIIAPTIVLCSLVVVLTVFWYPNALQLIIQLVTVLAFLFTAYVWWARARDRRIEPLEKLRGALDYLSVRVNNLPQLTMRQKSGKVKETLKLYEEVSEGLAASRKQGGRISNELSNEVGEFIHLLYRHSLDDYNDDADGFQKLHNDWTNNDDGGICGQMEKLYSHLNKEIATHKFLNTIGRSITGYLHRFAHPRKEAD